MQDLGEGGELNAAIIAAQGHPQFRYLDHHDRLSWCDLQVFSLRDDRTVIVATERADNPGMSVTNAIECIAKRAALSFRLSPTKMIVIENYGESSLRNQSHEETFDLVSFELVSSDPIYFSRPSWRRLSATTMAEAVAEVTKP